MTVSQGVGAESKAVSASARLVGKGDPLLSASSKVKPIANHYDVVIHGDPDSFHVLHNESWVKIDHRALATYIEKSDYAGGPIRLISCKAGFSETGIAQDLANKLGTEVIAPTDTAWIHSSGKITIGRTALRDTGQWNRFAPTPIPSDALKLSY